MYADVDLRIVAVTLNVRTALGLNQYLLSGSKTSSCTLICNTAPGSVLTVSLRVSSTGNRSILARRLLACTPTTNGPGVRGRSIQRRSTT